MRVAAVFLAMTGLLLLAAPARSAPPRWELLGERTVEFTVDHDVIEVTAAEGRFDAIKLHVLRSGIELLDLKVVFGDGQTFDAAVRHYIRAGDETRAIELPGGHRVIKQVEFTYRSSRRGGTNAVVRLWGRH